MDKDTLSAVQNKRKMWKKYKYCRSPHNKERYDHAKTVSSMKVREAQARYEKSVALKAKLQNSEQSYKGKVKTHNYINRQNQSTTGKL
jgi:Holliday junction resolvase RusA-like endonuclease